MNQVVYKYSLETQVWLGDAQILSMGQDNKVLAVMIQDPGRSVISLWCHAFTDEKPLVQRKFMVIGTGLTFTHDVIQYIGSVEDGPFVWHVFEVK